MEIKKEIPSGAIDGVNKVFTLLNVASQIDDVFMDGAIYTDFTINGNILTLVDAPTLSLFVDYTTGTAITPVTTDVTFGDIKDKVWNLLGQKSTSTTFNATIVGDAINSTIRDVIRGRIVSRLDSRIYRAGKLWFNNGDLSIRIQGGSILSEPFNLGDTEITCATTSLQTSGYVLVGGDVIHYTNKSDTQLLGVSGSTINHLATEGVMQLYSLPTDFEKMNIVEYIPSQNCVIWNNETKNIPIPFNPEESYTQYYTILRTGNTQLLKIVGFRGEQLVHVNYIKKVYDLVNDTDVCLLPDNYGLTVVAYLVAGQLAFEKSLPNGQPILKSAYDNLQAMYQFFTNDTNVVKQSIKPISYKNIR